MCDEQGRNLKLRLVLLGRTQKDLAVEIYMRYHETAHLSDVSTALNAGPGLLYPRFIKLRSKIDVILTEWEKEKNGSAAN